MKKEDLEKGDLIMAYNQLVAIVLETNKDKQFVDPVISYYGEKKTLVTQSIHPYYINHIISRNNLT